MDTKMQGAMLSGLFNLSMPVRYSCPTGNCRWNEYSTLAVGSSWRNVSDTTRVDCWNDPVSDDYSCDYTTSMGIKLRGNRRHYYFGSVLENLQADYGPQVGNTSVVNFAMV
jgi:hypothetical protein